MLASSGFDGLEMIAAAFIVRSNQCTAAASPDRCEQGVQEKFAIPFPAKNGRFDGLNMRAAQLLYERSNFPNSFLLRLGIANDPTFANLFPPDLKLGLHKGNQIKPHSA